MQLQGNQSLGLCYQAFIKASGHLHIIENTTLGLCAIVPSPYNGSDCIFPVFETEMHKMLRGLIRCVTGFGQGLY